MYIVCKQARFSAFIGLILLIVALSGCSNDLELISPAQPLIFVYSVIKPGENYQYVRINKSFIGEKSAYEMAKVFDSLYPVDIEVNALLFKKGDLAQTIPAGVTFEVPKDSGMFHSKKNQLYKMAIPDLLSYDSIRIQVTDTVRHYIVSGSTAIAKPGKIIKPLYSDNKIFFFGSDYAIKWLPGFSYFNYLSFTFHYREETLTDELHRSFDFRLQQTFNSDTIQDYILSIDQLMDVVSSNIRASDDVIVRWLDSIDIGVTSCERFLYEYSQIHTYNPSESAWMYYTNINNGSGIVSSLTRCSRTGLFLDRIGLDSLKNGRFTKQLHFSRLQ